MLYPWDNGWGANGKRSYPSSADPNYLTPRCDLFPTRFDYILRHVELQVNSTSPLGTNSLLQIAFVQGL